MKHNKLIAALATAGGLLVMGSAHAIAPAAAAAAGILGGAIAGSAAANANPPAVAVVPAPAPSVAVVPNTVVMGSSPTVIHETIPASPGANYRWEQGRFEMQNGVSTYVPGRWVSDVVIYDSN